MINPVMDLHMVSPRVIASGSVAISAHAKREIYPCDIILPLNCRRGCHFWLRHKITKTKRSDLMNTFKKQMISE